MSEPDARESIAWKIIGTIAFLRLALYAVSTVFFPYGYTAEDKWYTNLARRTMMYSPQENLCSPH